MLIIISFNKHVFAFSGGSGLPSRSKYVLDPSVQSNPYGVPRNQQFTPSAAPAPFQPTPQPFQPANFQTNALSSNPLQPTTQQPLNPTPLVPSFPQSPPTNFGGGGAALQPTSQPISAQPTFQSNALGAFPSPVEGLPPPPPLEVGQSAMNYLPANAAPGWNDPPVLSKSVRPQVRTNVYIYC